MFEPADQNILVAPPRRLLHQQPCPAAAAVSEQIVPAMAEQADALASGAWLSLDVVQSQNRTRRQRREDILSL